jgi:excisionase family DNA binding protein
MDRDVRLTLHEAARMVDRHPEMIRRAMEDGRLPFVRVGRQRVVRTSRHWLSAWSGGCFNGASL